MRRTTIMLPESLRLRAQAAAEDLGISMGELIRQALETTLTAAAKSPERDPFFADTDFWDGSGPADLAARHDDYLYGDEG